MKKFWAVPVLLMLLTLVSGCVPEPDLRDRSVGYPKLAPERSKRGYISREMFGDKWPLSVPDGVVSCEDGHFVLLTVKGETYAVNGSAKDAVDYQGKDWRKFDSSGLWLPDPKIPGAKIDISPVIDTGLDICKEQKSEH